MLFLKFCYWMELHAQLHSKHSCIIGWFWEWTHILTEEANFTAKRSNVSYLLCGQRQGVKAMQVCLITPQVRGWADFTRQRFNPRLSLLTTWKKFLGVQSRLFSTSFAPSSNTQLWLSGWRGFLHCICKTHTIYYSQNPKPTHCLGQTNRTWPHSN